MQQLSRNQRLALVVACTQTKAYPACPPHRVRDLPDLDADQWTARLRASDQQLPLRDLYRGQQWLASLDLARTAAALYKEVDLWVCSAGLGLHGADHRAPAYQASFSPSPDRVGSTLPLRATWWTQLLAAQGAPNLRLLRQRYDAMIVVLSPEYLRVVASDLPTDDEVVVVTSSTRDGQAVSESGLRRHLGGSDQTLNQRAAQQYLCLAGGAGGGAKLGSAEAHGRWSDWVAGHPPVSRLPVRKTLVDAEVLDLIGNWLTEATPLDRCPTGAPSVAPSASALLRRLRDEGLACSQERFQRLYHQTIKELV